MKSQEYKNPLHNPFYNRFNDPVRQRHDDMQAQAYTLWLKEQNRILPPRTNNSGTAPESEATHWAGRIAGAVVLLVLAISVGVLMKMV